MSQPPLRNPWSRFRAWSRTNRAQVEIVVIAGVFIGLIVIMAIITLVIILRALQ